jgi:hypothetical protein
VKVAVNDAQPGSAKWWLRRLYDEFLARSSSFDTYHDMVEGEHPLPSTTETSLKYIRMAGLATTNLTGLAVEATAERMSIEGIRIGDEPDADKSFWDDVWQRSDFDAGSQEAITAALVFGRSGISVGPPVDGHARLNFEDPRQVIIAHTPEGDRAAALKVFTDEWTGSTFATLYLPDYVVRMQQAGTPMPGNVDADPRWVARSMGMSADPVIRNPFGEVPFFELRNRPLGEVRSEIANLITPQLLLNQTMFNIEAIAEYGAFRQKWATGIEVPRDPSTGQPVAPYEAHLAKLFVAEGPDARFGDFGASDLGPHLEFAREIAAHISRLSRVPITYFLSNVNNIGGDALALLISGLVLKCQRRVTGYEPALEGASRLALKSMGDARATVANIEVKWADMETRSMAQSADAAVKLTSGTDPVITPQTAQEKYLGMSQTERDRDDAWRREGRASSNLDELLAAAQAEPLP